MHRTFSRLAAARVALAIGASLAAVACQSLDARDSDRSALAAAQGGLSAPPEVSGASPTGDDIIIDDNAPRLPIMGGYAPADPNDVGANAAEKLAIEEIYRREPQRALVENVQRELQIVAGVNYRFVVRMSGGARYQVVVYRPLQGDMQVTAYEKLG